MATIAPTPPPTATPAATPSPAPSASEAAASVHVDLPKGWQQVQLTAAALNAQIKAQASNPDLAASYQQLLDSGAFKGFLFYALD
jgi:hypothetical protein